jgi:cytochrome c-type biogenesis protein CcmH/NrfF
MNKAQKVTLALTVLNLSLILMFPPFDDYSVTSHGVAIFGGFRFFLYGPPNSVINLSFLSLEVTVLLVNAAIFWLITLENQARKVQHQFSYRKATLYIVAANLVTIVLFPPFEYISNMTRATIPTFEGFYFVFSRPPDRAIVMPILWLEAIFVLINGGLLLLAFRERTVLRDDSEAKAAELMEKLKKRSRT